MGARISSVSVNAIASASAAVILGVFSYKFFSLYKRGSKKNFLLLFYGVATAVLSISIAGDAIDKIIVQRVIVEQGTPSIAGSSFIYKTFEKYDGGRVQYKVVEPDGTTTLYILPSSEISLHKQIVVITSDPKAIVLWISAVTLLTLYYQRTTLRLGNLPIKYLILLSIPLILFLVGSGLIFSLPADSEFRQYQRIIFRAGSIGSSIMYGVAFFVVTRNIPSKNVKDYLTITAIGIMMVGVSFSVSALQQTYGAAGHSLLLLSSSLYVIGLYASGIFLAQDAKLRSSIKNSANEEATILVNAGNVSLLEMHQLLEKRVMKKTREQEQDLLDRTGVHASLTESEMKQYLSGVIKEIKILQDYEEILEKEKYLLETSSEYFACLNRSALNQVENNDFYYSSYKKVMERSRKGEHNGIRWITVVDKDTLKMIKPFVELGVQVRHVDNLPPLDFAVSDKGMVARLQRLDQLQETKEQDSHTLERPNTVGNLLVTNEPVYIDHFISIFNELWNNGIDIQDRIEFVEQGLEPEFIEVINNSNKAVEILKNLAKSTKKEALFLLPNDKAMIRSDGIHIIDSLIDASRYGKAVIKIICPLTDINREIVDKISEKAPMIQILDGSISTSGFLIVDGSKFLRAELRDPDANNIDDAIGFAIYSNSRLSVESFRSIFDLLWKQQVINTELKRASTLQSDFINIAAHELRTPIQPILGLSEMLSSSKTDDTNSDKALETITRNAKRLHRLTEKILDVARIESNSMMLYKMEFNLVDVLNDVINDFKYNVGTYENVKFVLNLEGISGESTLKMIQVLADKDRIIDVISNLVDNALKFSIEKEEDTIICIDMVLVSKENLGDGKRKDVIVTVKDTGMGIDPTVLPHLFSKFASKSHKGTGLGLYIAKNVIEAHGGEIWAYNNADGKGATFGFSLPIVSSNSY